MQRNRSKIPAASQWLFAVAVTVSLSNGPAVAAQDGRNAAGTTSVVPANARAQMWAATARFVYTDDSALKPIQAELLQTIRDDKVSAFSRGVDDAVRLEKQKLPKLGHVLKFQGIFKTIQEQPIAPSDYGGLAQAIITELQKNPDRMADLERKCSLAALSSQLNRLATGTATTAAEAASVAPTLADVTDVEATPVQDSGTDAYEVPEEQQQPEAQTDIPTSTPTPAMPAPATSPLLWAALLLSGLSLLGVLYLLLKVSKLGAAIRQRSSSSGAGLRESQRQEVYDIVREELKRHLPAPAATPLSKLKQAPKPPTQQAKPQAAAPVSVVPPVAAAPAPEQIDDLFVVNPQVPVAPVPMEPMAPRVHVLYANQQPINGAFLRDNLADAPASYTIFEILVDERTPDQGTFVVTRNESGHGGYIGSHMSILEPACTYNYPTGPVSRIITETPGTVQRTPSGDWRINQKARIYFA